MTSLEPVRLHVPAKRYLCATRAEYLGKLSRASVLILKLQGGLMSDAEIAAFEAEPFFREALQPSGCCGAMSRRRACAP